MAEIKGKNVVKATEKDALYTLETSKPIKGGVKWTISLESGSYKETKISDNNEIWIDFNNKNNKYNITLIIKAEYSLIDGTRGDDTIKVTLQGYNKDETNPANKEAKPDTGNKSATVKTADNKQKTEEKEVALKIHVYFDGTFGNKENIRVMEQAMNQKLGEKKPNIHDDKYKKGDGVDHVQYEEDLTAYKAKVEGKKDDIQDQVDDLSFIQKVNSVEDSENIIGKIGKGIGYAIGADPTSGMNSYTQVYTNIPIIYDMEDIEVEADEEIREKIIKVYIEGVGTQNYMGDDFMALATGSDSGGMGIPSKVNRAFEEIEEELNKENIETDKIKSVEICVIGFSRGAATSRSFVAEDLAMLLTLKKVNEGISKKMITYKFVGVFDTVCSVTDFTKKPKARPDTVSRSVIDSYITSLQKNNIKDYKLAMGGKVKEIVHLVAADEHRLFFPLTTINTSIDANCGFELVLPGSHCDLGGGDPDVFEEAFTEVVMKGDKDPSLAEYLMKNNWYDKTEPSVVTEMREVPVPINYGPWQGSTATGWKDVPVGKQYNLKRKVIVGYNRIPLAIMLHFATRFGEIVLKDKDKSDRTKIHDELIPVKNKLLNYAKSNHEHGRNDKLVGIFNRDFGHLRKKYLHLSAVLDFVQDVSEDKSNIAEIKDVARLNSRNEPNRAILSDRTDWGEIYAGVSDAAEKVVDAVKEKAAQKVEEAKEKMGDIIEDAVEEVIDAGKDAVIKGAKKAAKKILDNFGRPILK